MSQENVEIVRRAWEAHERHDDVAVRELFDPRVEIILAAPAYDGQTSYRGPDAVRDYYRNLVEVFGSLSSEVEEWIDAGDYVIAIMRWWGHGRQSGVPVESREAHVWTLQAGKMRRLRIYPTRSQALEAVGLRE